MRICHITTVHPRYDIRIFKKECISAVKAGNEVFLVVNDDQKDEEIEGVNIVTINTPFKNKFQRVISRTSKKKAFIKAVDLKADIYHFHDPELLGVGIKLKKNGFRVVYDSHEDVPRQILAKEWIPKALRNIISYVFELYENHCSRKFNSIVVPTPHIKERFLKLNKSVWEVCNYPALDDIEYSGENYSVDNPASYIGDLSNTRGIRQISEAAFQAGVALNLCGKFHSEGLESEVLGKFSNINYLGFLDRNEVSKVLCNSSMGFVTLLNTPNDSTSYPIKMFEYMAAGIPVISSDFPVYKQIIEGNECGICVNPLDVSEITKAIRLVKSDLIYADLLRKNGRRAIVEKYNWETESIKLHECYKHCILN